MTGIRVGRDNREKADYQVVVCFSLCHPNRIEPLFSAIEYFLLSRQKLTFLLSGPNTLQGHHRYPDLQVFGKKS